MSIIPFPRFQLEKSRKAVFKECAKLDLVISLKSQRKEICWVFKVHKPSKVREKKIGKNQAKQGFFPKFYIFWGKPFHSKLHNQNSINIQQVLI